MKAVITADWHIRATRPRCRLDREWIQTQKNALNQIVQIANDRNCPIFAVGDIFHSNSDTSFECVKMVQELAKKTEHGLYMLCGNHDLQYHSSLNLDRSAVGLLLGSENIFKISDYEDDVSASNFDEKDNAGARIIFKHVLTIPKENIPPHVECETPESLLEKFPKSQWIFTGDYHKNFHYEKDGRHVVNSGCLLRQVSDMKDYSCGVYFVDTEDNFAEFIPIIDNEGIIDDSYITKENEREKRIEDFVDKLKNTKSVSLDFLANVENALKQNVLSDDLKKIVGELLEC
jgi:hypothetical protein